MPISDEVRQEVMERDNGECQFWHARPFPATVISHQVHQGIGGRPVDSDVNQSKNLAASCPGCHRRLHKLGKPYVWLRFEPARKGYRGVLEIRHPSGKLVPANQLWFYLRWSHRQVNDRYLALRNAVRSERHYAWEAARLLNWFKNSGMADVADPACKDYIDLAATFGFSSAQAKKRVRVRKFRMNQSGEAVMTLDLLSIDIADRLRKVPKDELPKVAGWFAEDHIAEAWSKFNEDYPGSESQRTYRIFTGKYDEVRAATDEQALSDVPDTGIVVKGGSVIRGILRDEERRE